LPPLIELIETTLKDANSDSKKTENEDEDTNFLIINGGQLIHIFANFPAKKGRDEKEPAVVTKTAASSVTATMGLGAAKH
jgi:hypothetical protein